MTGAPQFELKLEDGPYAEVGHYSDLVVQRFDWPVNQRFYMTVDEARQVAQALIAQADAIEAGQ